MIHRLNTGKHLPNFAVECHKVYEGLQTPLADAVDVQSFRRLVGQGHPDFGTAGQQDVVEYLTFLLTKFEDHELTRRLPPVFQIGLEECLTKEGQDTYKKSVSPILSLPPPAIDGSSASFDSCLAQVFGQTLIDGTNYLSQTRVRSFPAYLFVQISRYALEGGQVRKVVERLEVPAHLNLEAFRATPKEDSAYASREEFTTPPFLYNAEMLEGIQNMGFSKTAGEKALKAVNNANLEAATEWILAHMEDPTLNDELPAAGPVDTSTLEAMGFSQAHAEVALKACKFQVEAALEFLFGKSPEELDKLITQSTAEPELSDGPAQYQLVGFISHIGNHPATGHYVAHCMKEVEGTPKWVQFNDEKVYLSQEPPTDAGYLYLFQRKTL
jgi:ubiquitin carboxyl-terminal hydrolase 5/13